MLFSDLSAKLGALAQRHGEREMLALTTSRVAEAFLRPAHVVDGSADIVAVATLMQAQRTGSVLVRDGARLGIFTSTGLQRAVVDGRPLAALPVRELATFKLVSISPDAPLFDALALMIEHQVHRLVVAVGDQVTGLLEQLDLLSFLSNRSYLITLQIAQAQDLDALAVQATKIGRFVALLYRGGTRVGQIGKLVQALNAKLFERAWQLVAPPALVADSCLFVMGSEGRGEQTLKTDQDNGLIVRDGATVSEAEIAEACRRLMALAIFIDAHTVAGDSALLAEVRAEVDRLVAADDALLGRFAAAIDSFPEESGSWWNRLLLGEQDKPALDLKKSGIFPIVHGVRSLALSEHVPATGTQARIDALVAGGRLSSAFGTDLGDSLHFLMGLKLKAGLAELDTGGTVSGGVRSDRLSSLERDLLKDALAVVKRFKAIVRNRFRLEAE
jgi:CBS domain-containing protein